MAGSIRFKNGGSMATPSNTIISGQSKFSIWWKNRINSSTVAGSFNTLSFPGGNNQALRLTDMILFIFGSGNNDFSNDFVFVPGQTSIWCLSYDATGTTNIYVNNFIAATNQNMGVLVNSAGPITFAGNAQADYNISNFIYWTGYNLQLTDIQNPNIASNPFSINSGVACYLTMDGPLGNGVFVGDSGITNKGFSGSSYSVSSITSSGHVTYDQDLVYIAPVITNSYITSTSGFVAFIMQNNGVYYYGPTISINPTYVVNTNGVIQSGTFSGGIKDSNVPWVLYPWNVPSTTGSIITYSAPYGWITGFLSQTGYINNLYKQDNFPFQTPSTRWGFNLENSCVYYQNDFFFRNLAMSMYNPAPKQKSSNDPAPRGGSAGTAYNAVLQYSTPNLITSSVGGAFPTGVWHYSYTDDPTFSSTINLAALTAVQTPNIIQSTIMSGIKYCQGSTIIRYGDRLANLDPHISVNFVPHTASGILVDNLFVTEPGNSFDSSNKSSIEQNMLYQLSTTSGKFCPVIRCMTQIATNNSNIINRSHLINPSGFSWSREISIDIPTLYTTPYVYSVTPSAYYENFGWLDLRHFQPKPNPYIAFHVFSSGNHGLYSGQWVNIFQSSPIVTTGNGQACSFNFGSYPMNIVTTSPSSFVFFLQSAFPGATGIEPMTLQNTTNSIFSFNYELHQGMVPYESAIDVVAQISGCDLWFNIPAYMDYPTSTYLANYAFNSLPSGRTVYLEYTNEHWNDGTFYQGTMLKQETYFRFGIYETSQSKPNVDKTFALNSAAHHDIWDAVWISGGRPGLINRVFGAWYTSADIHNNIITAAISNNLKIDSFCYGPYVPNTGPYSSTVVSATAAFTGMMYYDMTRYHDLFRHFMWYELTNYNYWPQTRKDLNVYGTGVQILYYEAATYNPIAGVFAVNVPSGLYLQSDFFYHPENKRTMQTYYQLGQSWGATAGCYFTLDDKNFYPNSWFMIACCDQLHGNGDGSDGLAVNKFSMGDGLTHDDENISPAMQGWHDYINANVNVQSFNVKPSVISEIPSSGNVGVSGITPIIVNFNKSINPASVHLSLFDGNNNLLSSTTTPANFSATLLPTAPLSVGTQYTLQVSGLVDTIGIPQQGVFSFNFNNVPVPTLTVSPQSVSVVYNNISTITPTLTNATGLLTASSLHGTISGSILSATPFTYTAPSSGTGFTTDVVTVTDLADNLTATCNIFLAAAPTPGLTVTPTSASVGYGKNTFITPHLVNSSATLTASALHGSVSGSIISSTQFTYTAPASGFTSDVVTVTDTIDSLTATCSITLTNITRYSFYVTNNRIPVYIQLVL